MKKLLSILLVLAMVLALAPAVFASEEAVIVEEIEAIEEEPAAEPEEAPALDGATYSGTCGTNVTWSLDTSTGVLTVSGTGYMDDSTFSSDTPWYPYSDSIKSVVIKDGVKSVGERAFCYYYDYLTSVTLGNSVETIGSDAFMDCDLRSVEIPDSVVSIGEGAFYHNKHLTSVTLGNSLETIGDYAFDGCDLHSLTLPDSITTIGKEAFCDNETLSKVVRPKHDITIGEHAIGWWYEPEEMEWHAIDVEFVYAEAKPTLTFASDAKSVKATGGYADLFARVALVIDNNGVSGLYITQATINADGTILIPEFIIPGLKVKGVNVTLVPSLADIQSTTPNAKATATKML